MLRLAWNIPDIFLARQPRDILFSYNGSNLSLYINGRKDLHTYDLGPGTRLVELIRWGRTPELDEYNYAYDALIFIPAVGASPGSPGSPCKGVRETLRDMHFLSQDSCCHPGSLS